MRVGALAIGLTTIMAGFLLCIYGLYLMNPAEPMVGMAISIIGLFLGMAGFLIVFVQLFSGESAHI